MNSSVEDYEMTYDPEIEKLLPWYAKGLLEAKDQESVETYLATHPDMRMQLDLIEEEGLAVKQQHAALGSPAPGGLDRLLADIDSLQAQEEGILQRAGRHGSAPGLFARMSDGMKKVLANFSSPAMQLVGAAAAVVIVAQAVVIGGLMKQGPETAPMQAPAFTTAAGPEDSASRAKISQGASVFLIAFKKEARIDAVNALLKSLSAKIVAGPKAGGFYQIKIETDLLPEGGERAVLARLKANTELVQFVSIGQ
ncbi:hypothetical protein [uncultured Cohaesibacter sp.]|uniref:hypothetical protein n=1 Tax=uncultured Cohaesibacter sp. TaxID=1002546 RepID=UPI002AA8C4E1|nr:hypothetical protein [uncultured Cohaesibacter sp.]